MNHRLSCDEVFDHLTRAPFPAGEDSDQSVDDHLRVCHECRQMAEALRPATDLFREVMSDDQRRRLPAYRGQLATLTRDRSVASSAVTSSRTEFRGWNPVSVDGGSWHQQRYFLPALGLALLLMAAILHGRGMVGASSTSDEPISGIVANPDHETACVMAGFALPSDCLPRSIVGPVRPKHAKPSSQPSGSNQQMKACLSCHESVRLAASEVCCTNCHAANLQKPSGGLQKEQVFPRLATSCVRCHEARQRS